MTESIGINSPNPHDVTPEELEDIATAIRDLNLNYEVKVSATERKGVAVTWFEVLRVALYGAAFEMGRALTKEVANRIAQVLVDWARERFRRRKSGSRRPVYVAIYGPDGIVKSVVVKNATDEPEDRTEQDQNLEKSVKNMQKDK